MMRKWLSDQLFSWALRVDEEHTTMLARLWIDAEDFILAMTDISRLAVEPKKRGRPKGRKDRVGLQNQTAPKKRGRPLGSKNKPKGVNDGAIG